MIVNECRRISHEVAGVLAKLSKTLLGDNVARGEERMKKVKHGVQPTTRGSDTVRQRSTNNFLRGLTLRCSIAGSHAHSIAAKGLLATCDRLFRTSCEEEALLGIQLAE